MRWFSRLTLKLFLSFLLMLSLMAAQGLFALSRIHEIQQKTDEIVTDWSPSVRLLREMQVNLMLHRSFDLRHALTDDPALKSDLERQMQERLIRYKENEGKFSRLIDSSEAEEKRIFDDFREKLDQYLAQHKRFLELSRRNNLPEIRQWVEGDSLKLRLALEGALNKLVGYNVQGGLKADQEGRALAASASGWVLGLLLVGVGLSALYALASTRAILNPLARALRLAATVAEGNLLTDRIELTGSDEVGQLLRAMQDMQDRLRALITKIQQAGIQIATSSTEISASVRQQEATVSEQATSSSQIAASTKEISVTTKEFSKGMDEVVRIAEDTARLATDGQERLSRIDHSIEQMVAASNIIASKLALLNDKADNINTVLATVTKVADQTNLLSINAAIEAEKAGEYGRGFSVVATEIRRLADQTGAASLDIEQMLKEILSAVAAGVMGMDKFSDEIRRNVGAIREMGQQLSNIIARVESLAPRFEDINQGMLAQSVGAEQITQAMAQFNDGMQQTAESLRGWRQTVELLTDAAHALRGGVEQFKLA